jgi:hypothetical protein
MSPLSQNVEGIRQGIREEPLLHGVPLLSSLHMKCFVYNILCTLCIPRFPSYQRTQDAYLLTLVPPSLNL